MLSCEILRKQLPKWNPLKIFRMIILFNILQKILFKCKSVYSMQFNSYKQQSNTLICYLGTFK